MLQLIHNLNFYLSRQAKKIYKKDCPKVEKKMCHQLHYFSKEFSSSSPSV